jgi:hypothetical protein
MWLQPPSPTPTPPKKETGFIRYSHRAFNNFHIAHKRKLNVRGMRDPRSEHALAKRTPCISSDRTHVLPWHVTLTLYFSSCKYEGIKFASVLCRKINRCGVVQM